MNLPPGAQRNSEAVAALAAVAVSVPPVGSIAYGSAAARPAGRLEQPLHWRWALALLVALLLVPPVATALQQAFYIDLASRILIFALAATSLNLILGFGGMISFGHAAFVGLGAYTVAILMQGGVVSAWVTWPLAVGVSALFALGIGAISLRTRGVYFIMITLAFAQMLYYLMVSLKAYGGEDGLSLAGRSIIVPGLDLRRDTSFYYVALTLFALAFTLIQRILNARFGATLQAIQENETRMQAIGFPVYRYKLVAFMLAGAIAGLAGALVANQTGFVSPALLQWNHSGLLMMMVILGGVGQLYGGFVGALLFIVLEELLSAYSGYWQFGLGAILLGVVLLSPNGVMGLLGKHFGAGKHGARGEGRT